MADRLAGNLAAAVREDFSDRVAGEIWRRGVHTLRVHVGGDFFDGDYVAKWASIAKRSPRTTLYGYTRSWRDPATAEALAELSALENVRLWYSADAETGFPANLPPGVRVAYLQTEPLETPTGGVVFRVRELRRERPDRFPLHLVCPVERAEARSNPPTCTSCRRCFT